MKMEKLWFRHSKGSQVAIMDIVSHLLLHHWELEFSEFKDSSSKHNYLLVADGCNLIVSRSSLLTMQPFWIPTNPYLTSILTFYYF